MRLYLSSALAGPDFRVETWQEPGSTAWVARLTPIRPEVAPFGDVARAVVEVRPGLEQAVRAVVQCHLAAHLDQGGNT